jgi:ATP-dependent RNA helicase DDX1
VIFVLTPTFILQRAALQSFKDGDARILIATDVAARGIDIKELPYVINVTLPDEPENYIHRYVGDVHRGGSNATK